MEDVSGIDSDDSYFIEKVRREGFMFGYSEKTLSSGRTKRAATSAAEDTNTKTRRVSNK